jgi:hypothetical protein
VLTERYEHRSSKISLLKVSLHLLIIPCQRKRHAGHISTGQQSLTIFVSTCSVEIQTEMAGFSETLLSYTKIHGVIIQKNINLHSL